jgi:hypothetical protein
MRRGLRCRRPHLAPVDDPAVVRPLRARLDARRIEPRIRLGHTETTTGLATDQRRQYACLLLLGAEHRNRMRPEDVDVDRRDARHRRTRARDCVHHQCSVRNTEPCSAHALRHRDTEVARRSNIAHERVRKSMIVIPRQPEGVVVLRTNAPDTLDDGGLCGCRLEHQLTLSPNVCTAAAIRVPPVIQHMMP